MSWRGMRSRLFHGCLDFILLPIIAARMTIRDFEEGVIVTVLSCGTLMREIEKTGKRKRFGILLKIPNSMFINRTLPMFVSFPQPNIDKTSSQDEQKCSSPRKLVREDLGNSM